MKVLLFGLLLTGNAFADGYTCQGQCIGISANGQDVQVFDTAIHTSADAKPAQVLRHLSSKCRRAGDASYWNFLVVDEITIDRSHRRSGESMDRSNTRTNERNVQSDSHSEGALHGRTSRSRTRRDRPRARRRDTETQNYYWWQNNFQNTNETEVETEEEQVNIDRYDNQIHYDYTPASVRNNCWKDTDADEQGLEYLGRLPEMF